MNPANQSVMNRVAAAPPRKFTLSFPHSVMLFLPTSSMPQPASAPIQEGVIDVLNSVSRRPIKPTLQSDLNDVPATRTVAQVVAQVTRLVEERPKT